MKFNFSLATPEDDLALRCLFADTSMPGRITVAFEREPNYFAGCSTLGPFWQVIIARPPERREIAGVFCRSVRQHFINGEPQNLGYIGQIRVAEEYRGLWLLQQALPYFCQLHNDGRVQAYWGAISEENKISRGVLVERGWKGFPKSYQVAQIYTLGIILRRYLPRIGFDGQVERGSEENLSEIITFLQQFGSKRQFFPVYCEDDFRNGETIRDFDLYDFVVARRDGDIVGVMGLWDQGGYKQSIVRGYDRLLAFTRPLYNLGAPLFGIQPLPALGEKIHSVYASFVCIAQQDPQVFKALLREIYNLAVSRRYAYLMLGLSNNDPLLPSAKSYPHITYRSQVFLSEWQTEGKNSLYHQLDQRVPYIEIAAL